MPSPIPPFTKFLTKIEADNKLGFGSNRVFTVPEGEMIELDCSKYEQSIISEEENATFKQNVDDFDDEF